MFFISGNVDIASYDRHDNTQHTHGEFPNMILEKLECASRNIFEWFFSNAMKVNPDKYHFLPSLDISTKISASSFNIENTHSQKLLGVTFDFEVSCHDHVSNLCKKASAKITATVRVFLFMILDQKKLTMKAVLMSQFG